MIDTRIVMMNIDIQTAIEFYTGNRFKHGKVSCPFHTDKTPSLSIKNSRFRCWSCGASGSVIDFVRQLFGLSFVDAVRKLSIDFGITVEGLDGKTKRPDLWDDIRLQIAKERATEITGEIERLAKKADNLTDRHRMLFQMGDLEAAEKVAEQIDRINGEIDFLVNCK